MNTTKLAVKNTQNRHCDDGGHHCESQPYPDSSRLHFFLLVNCKAVYHRIYLKNGAWTERRSAGLSGSLGANRCEGGCVHARAALSRTKFEGVGPNFGVHDKISL